MSKKLLFTFVFTAILLTGGYLIYENIIENTEEDDFKRCSEQYPFVSSELDCGTINEKIGQVEGIDHEIENVISQAERSGQVQQVSVFFRDLNTRRWFGINENVNFYPASLAKLPIAMMFYKTAEVNSNVLKAPLSVTQNDLSLNDGEHYKPKDSLEAEKQYPLKELLRHLLVYSDNAPVNSLMDASNSFRDAVLSDLGIYFTPQEDETVGTWNISAKSYANLFRVLYNSSYLRPEYSNEILQYLSQSTFDNGLVSGLPKDTKVAHKFGEIGHTDEKTGENVTILNDCGIIYKKNNPYILCVMTQGNNFENLEKIIQTISEKVYISI